VSATLSGAFTLGFSLSVATSSLSSGFLDVSGYLIQQETTTTKLVLSQDCYKGVMSKSKLSEEFINAVAALPLNPANPQLKSSWQNYQIFLDKYGSHIVTEITLGSLIRQYVFQSVEMGYSESDYRINACVEFEGPTTAGDIDSSTCTGISSADVQAAESRTVSHQLIILGGSDKTRNALDSTRTDALLEALMNEGRDNPQPVGYEYASIWDVIRTHFSSNSSMIARASTLQQFYEGFLCFGCTNVVIGGRQARFFNNQYDGNSELTPVYGCELIARGCHSSNHDCHIGGAGSVAYCYGPTCIEYATQPYGNPAQKPFAQTSQTGHYNSGLNLSCYFNAFKAYCKAYFSSTTIWGGQ